MAMDSTATGERKPGGSGLPIWESPLCLVETDLDGKLTVRDETLQQVAAIDKELVIVAVAGIYRTGKSYLMNRLAGLTSGFSLGSTIESKTKGIWIWARHHPIHEGKLILLLDTEGLGDAAKGDANHDALIFCLATLLSSVLVYNALGAINEDALGKLNFVAEMSKHIRTKQSEKSTDENFDWYFPEFIFALRDFMLELEIDGNAISENEYLEHCLTLKNGDDKAQQKFNQPRAAIRKYFKKRDCFTFDRPGGRNQLRKMETISDSELSKDFVEDTIRFCNHIFSSAPVKQLENGQTLNGRMWTALVLAYVTSMRNGDVPCIENAVASMALIENTRAVKEGTDLYLKSMPEKDSFPTPDDSTLSELHVQCLSKALTFFLSKVIWDTDQAYQRQLNEQIAQEYANMILLNQEKSKENCLERLRHLEGDMQIKMEAGSYSKAGGYADYAKDLSNIVQQYEQTKGLGVKFKEVLLEYMSKKMDEGKTIMAADKEITEKEKLAEEQRMKAIEAEHQREIAERERQFIQQQADEQKETMQENIKQLHEKQEKEMVELRKHQEDLLNTRMAEQKRLMDEGFKRESDALGSQVDNMAKQMAKQESDFKSKLKEQSDTHEQQRNQTGFIRNLWAKIW